MKIINKIIVIIIAVVGLYAAFFIASDIRTVYDKIINFKIEFLLIIIPLVTSGWFVLFARWHLLLKNSKIFIPKKDSLLIFFSGFALTIIPGKVGELIKSQLLKTKFEVPRSKTVPIVMLEQFYTLIGLVIISFFGIWFFELGAYVIGFFTALLIFAFILISSKKVFNKLITIFEKRKFTSRFVDPLSSSYDIIKKSTKGPITFYASALTVIFWFIEAVVVYLVLLSFGVENMEFLMVIPTYTTSLMLGFLSFLPMGLGVVEGSLASFFSLQGIEVSLSLTIVIIIRIFTRWYGVAVGFLALRLSGGLTFDEESTKT
uniref:Putative integral membrane protein n=1 Tax=uncultured marine thaumarchaeote KM3_38_E02 TaxID=1456138 RepID=A0A075H6Q1_9ARCH|nr:putative integral membrane protein [uncultured marine thaumarchaeote KM3_38_E02]